MLFEQKMSVKHRSSEFQQVREKSFEERLKQIFDIGHKEADKIIKIEEDRVFLADQRGPRLMRMTGIDKKMSQKEDRSQQRKTNEYKRKEREEKRKEKEINANPGIVDVVTSADEDDKTQSDTEVDYEFQIPIHYKNQMKDLTE